MSLLIFQNLSFIDDDCGAIFSLFGACAMSVCPVFMAVNLCPFADMFRSMPTSVYAFMFVFFSVFAFHLSSALSLLLSTEVHNINSQYYFII